jgi:hypothetical protein
MHALTVGASRQSYASPESSEVSKREPVSMFLDGEGNIIDCTECGERLFGFQRSELKNQHISMLFPFLAEVELLKNGHLNPFLHYLCNSGVSFQARACDGITFDSELHFVELVRHGQMPTVRLVVLPFVEAE